MAQRSINPAGALRDMSNANMPSYDIKDRHAVKPPPPTHFPTTSSSMPTSVAPVTARSSSNSMGFARPSGGPRMSSESSAATARASAVMARASNSPQADRRHKDDPTYATEYIHEIVDHFLEREKTLQRDANYLAAQPEINEKMRTILVDWLVDVHLKFKLHAETFYLAVDIVDRFLSIDKGNRATLQLVGITSMLLAAKYEEIWPPEVKDCIYISANTYTRDDILKMENRILAALQFKLTTPTPYPILARLLDVTEADTQTRHAALFYLENAMLDYKHLQHYPSELANASMYLANLMLRKPEPWGQTLQYYSKTRSPADFHACAKSLLEFATTITNSKYQAIRRKYSSIKYGEISRIPFPELE